MSARKQQLLKRHRRNKRIGLLVALLALLAVGLLVSPWLLPILLVALWVAHEAWFADHLFYSPGEDYRYRFAEGVESLPVRLADGRLRVDGELREGDTLVLGIGVRAGWLGRFLEPSVLLEGGAETDAQAFERGVNGLRYLNLTGLAGPLGEDRIRLRGRHCRLVGEPDSQAVPAWGGVPAERCVQLGYFCLQLPAMQANPGEVVPSREADLADIRPFRQFNRLRLASDTDGLSTWNNLLADLRELILLARPEVIVLPHPHFDPHPDHVRAQEAVREALQGLDWQPQALLHYANHLHDNDRWPMGDAHMGVSLPPLTEECSPLLPWTLALERTRQVDKAMALGMMHDLQPRPPFKRRLRRRLQGWLAGRRWPAYGEDEFMRKAVRRHELFWVESLDGEA
nr:PIG-L family deacetylase [Pseudomonas aeruginosa]